MVISLKKLRIPFAFAVVAVVAAAVITLATLEHKDSVTAVFMGGAIHTWSQALAETKTAMNQTDYKMDDGRFDRPSNQPPLPNPFTLGSFQKDGAGYYKVTNKFDSPQDAVKAFFGILKDAANMVDYGGGCGTIGDATIPYEYAYELLSPDVKTKISLSEFTDSFKGIGHITLLKLYSTYAPQSTPKNTTYYMFEIESITGPYLKDKVTSSRDGSYFTYHYGLATVVGDKEHGFNIKSIDYLPEDFLCAPMHGWSYDAGYVVQAVYHDWYKLIDGITGTEKKGNMIYVYASGKNEKYRFDFVRLTNGYDILLHENIYKNGKWVETNILKNDHQYFKLSPLNPNLYKTAIP